MRWGWEKRLSDHLEKISCEKEIIEGLDVLSKIDVTFAESKGAC